MRKFLLMFILLVGLARADVEINLPAEAVVDSEYIRLADIAELTGSESVRAGKVFLGPAPRTGSSMKIIRSDITQRLKGMGLTGSVDFSGSLGVTVNRGGAQAEPINMYKTSADDQPEEINRLQDGAATEETGSRYDEYVAKMEEASATLKIKDAVKRFVFMKLGNNMPFVLDVKIRKIDLDGVAGDKFTIQGIERGEIPGRCVLAALSSDENNNVSGYATVEAQIKLEIDAQVCGRNISKGQCVRRQDMVQKRIAYKPGMRVENINPDELDGRVALKTLRAGEPLSMAYFGSVLDVRKGQMVTVCVVGNGFTIKEMALALADGSVGDTIKVESVVSKSVYPVRVTGPNRADMPIASM